MAFAYALILLLGHRTFFAGPDNTTQFWAWYQKESVALHSGTFAVWDGNALGGRPFAGETQTGLLYPLNIIWLLVLGSAHGIGPHRLDLLVTLHLGIASVGFYALVRSFGLRPAAAVIAGAAFGYSGAVMGRASGQTAIFFGLALVPWALFFAHRQLETGRLRYAVAGGAMVGLGVLAGHFEPPFHAALIIVLFYALTGSRAGRSRSGTVRPRVIGLATTAIAAVIVAAPQLAYSLPYLGRAYRFVGVGPPVAPGGTISFDVFTRAYTGGPDSVLNLLDPQRFPVPDGNDLFLGLCALVVLVAGLLTTRGRLMPGLGRYRTPVVATLGVGALAMLGPWTPFPAVLYVLPYVSDVRELARYSILVHVVLCLVLAFGVEGLLRARGGDRQANVRRVRLGLIAAAVILVDGVFLLARPLDGTSTWFGTQVTLAGLTLLAIVEWRRRGHLLVGAAAVLIVLTGTLLNGVQHLGSDASPYYPPHYYARSPLISYAEQECRGHRILALGSTLPVNVGDVFGDLRTQNGYGATMLVNYYAFINATSPVSREQTSLLDLRCVVVPAATSVPGYQVGYRDPSGVVVLVNRHTSALNTPALAPVPATPLAIRDRMLRYRFSVSRPTKVILSAVSYPGWTLQLDGRTVRVGAYRVSNVAVFPEVTASPGTHVISYSSSGWPS